jgi:hypothetical protein
MAHIVRHFLSSLPFRLALLHLFASSTAPFCTDIVDSAAPLAASLPVETTTG